MTEDEREALAISQGRTPAAMRAEMEARRKEPIPPIRGPIRFVYPWGYLIGFDAHMCGCGQVRLEHREGGVGCKKFSLAEVDQRYAGEID